jgi:hypothetical protein
MVRQKVIRRCNFWGTAWLSILIAVLLFLSIPVCADGCPGDSEEEMKKDDEEWTKKFAEISDFLEKKKNDLFPIELMVDVSFNGHKAGDNSLFKLDIRVDIDSREYPSKFRFKAGTTLQFKNNILQEDVTTLLVSYNYYLEPWLMMYGFVERFSDSFLSIQHRYEIGGGIMFELDLGKKKREIVREKESYQCQFEKVFKEKMPETWNDAGDAISLRKKIEDHLPSFYYYNSKKKADELVKEEKCFFNILKKNLTRVSASLAFTIFSELEKAEIETFIDEQITGEDGTTRICEGTTPTKFPLEGEQRFRFTLRPRLEIKIGENFSIKGHIYLKYPLGKPQKVFGRTDYRYDGSLRAELNVSMPFSWAKKAALFFEYQRHYDNLPPRLAESIIAENLSNGKILRKTIADDTHEEFLFGLNIHL